MPFKTNQSRVTIDYGCSILFWYLPAAPMNELLEIRWHYILEVLLAVQLVNLGSGFDIGVINQRI